MSLQSGSRILVVNAIEDPNVANRWLVMAVEGGSKTKILDDHSHADLGVFKSAEKARAAAEAFARKWIAAKGRNPKCKCSEISTN